MENQKDDITYRLRERARIRRSISSRKSVQEGKPDRISDLLEESADTIDKYYHHKVALNTIYLKAIKTYLVPPEERSAILEKLVGDIIKAVKRLEKD